MKDWKNILKKRWVWGMGVFVLFTLLFTSFLAFRGKDNNVQAAREDFRWQVADADAAYVENYGTHVMRKRQITITLAAGENADKNWSVVEWSLPDSSAIKFVNPPGTSETAEIEIQKIQGSTPVNVTVERRNDDDTTTREMASITIQVELSLSEDLRKGNTYIQKAFERDSKGSLVMEYGAEVDVADSDNTDVRNLKFVFGDAIDATFESSNRDVIQCLGEVGEQQTIKAVGAGPAILTYRYTDGTQTYEQSTNVYVKPKLYQDQVGGTEVGVEPNTSIVMDNGDKIFVSVPQESEMLRPDVGIGDKLVWVITKQDKDKGQSVLIRDSLGNIGTEEGVDPDDARLVYISSERAYRMEAKVGTYTVFFFVKGTYTSYEDYRVHNLQEIEGGDKTRGSNITPVTVAVSIRCNLPEWSPPEKEEKLTIHLSLGSMYSLRNSFNLPDSMLGIPDLTKGIFTNASRPDRPAEPEYNINDWMNFLGWDSSTFTITANAIGHTYMVLKYYADSAKFDTVPGLTMDQEMSILIEVYVEDTFNLSQGNLTLAVGESKQLYGVVGSGTEKSPADADFHWYMDKEGYVTLSSDTGRYITVTGTRPTLGEEVIIRLEWVDGDTVWVSECIVTVTNSPTDFTIDPNEVEMEVGDTETLSLIFRATASAEDIIWISSDEAVVTVEARPDNTSALITAGNNSGTAVITALNLKNNAYATCIVKVRSAITEIRVDQGETYTVAYGTQYVFFTATYLPLDATSTDLIWTSSDTSIISINQSSGMATVLAIGQTTITVKPANNPNNVWAQCIVTVADVPITGIRTDVTSLTMRRGETYQVTATLTPANPTDPTITWSSNKTSVATVNANGLITAVGVGTATIMVQGGNANPVLIEVTVRERLSAIAFEETDVVITVNQTLLLNVIFSPAEGVDKTLHFRSSDESIVIVDNNGNITGISVGTAMVTCYADDLGDYYPITCNITVTEPIIDPSQFTIDPTETTIRVGDEFSILPIFTPAETTDQRVSYTALDPDIATVTADGIVTGVAPGKTVIQCTAVVNNVTALCSVTVEEAIEFSLSPSSREIAIGKSFKITKVTMPENVDKSAIWQSSNSKIASISSTGKVTGKKAGSCTITCTLKKYNQSATCRVKVAKLKTTLKLDKTSIRMNVGSTYKLKKTITTNNSSDPAVKFTSSNKKIATVGSSSGKIKAKKVGSAVITAKTKDEVRATARCRVIVINRATGISLNKNYAVCYIGSTIKLKATVKPNNASISKVKWTSEDSSIAAITGAGKITGYAEGQVYITAKTTDGSNKSARCLVKVSESVPATSVLVAQKKMTLERGNSAKISFTVLPNDTTDSIKMASDNKKVAKVTNAGKVTAVGTGTATITITTSSGTTSTLDVNVVALNKTSLNLRQYDTETLRVMGTSDAITWYSANSRIASVENGKVVGRSIGTTYVYAFIDGCRLACRVRVTSVNS